MSSAPLILSPDDATELAKLRQLGEAHPVDVRELQDMLKTPDGDKAHRARMTRQSMVLVTDNAEFMVTYSVEWGHPAPGIYRHMSLSQGIGLELPPADATWSIGQHFGFVGGLNECVCWAELLRGHGHAINVVQQVPN